MGRGETVSGRVARALREGKACAFCIQDDELVRIADFGTLMV
jgi:hypothetical protein